MVNKADLFVVREEEQDLSSADLTLQADTGESLEILARELGTGTDGDRIEEKVDETTMLTYRDATSRATLFPNELTSLKGHDLLGIMSRMGYTLPTIKVPEGMTYRMRTPDTGGSVDVWYREYRTAQFSPSDPGGPGSSQRAFITESNTDETISQNSTEIKELTTSINTGGITDWPWEEDVPHNREYDLMAAAFRVEEDPSGGGVPQFDAVRFNSEEVDFFARNSATVSDAPFQYPDADPNTRLPFFWMDLATGEPDPITFTPGDDLSIEFEITEAGNSADATVDMIASLVCLERRF